MKDLFRHQPHLPKELNDTLAEGHCVDFIFENYQIMRCMQQYLYDENAKTCKRTRLCRLYNSIQHQTCVCTPFQVPNYARLNKPDAV